MEPTPNAIAVAPQVNNNDVRSSEQLNNLHNPLSASTAPGGDDSLSEAAPNPAKAVLLTELRGSLARRREYDLWLIRNAANVMSSKPGLEKIMAYCATTAFGIEHALDAIAKTEYVLQADGKVLATDPRTPEQRYRDGQQGALDFQAPGPVEQECEGSLATFGTWHDQPMPLDEKFTDIISSARADLEQIDKTLDPRLIEGLPRPKP
jgi:hypothetical protein